MVVVVVVVVVRENSPDLVDSPSSLRITSHPQRAKNQLCRHATFQVSIVRNYRWFHHLVASLLKSRYSLGFANPLCRAMCCHPNHVQCVAALGGRGYSQAQRGNLQNQGKKRHALCTRRSNSHTSYSNDLPKRHVGTSGCGKRLTSLLRRHNLKGRC